MKYVKLFEEFVNESKAIESVNEDYQLTQLAFRELFFAGKKEAKEIRKKLSKSNNWKEDDIDYMFKRWKKDNPNPVDPSKSKAAPKKAPKVKWNQKKYDTWISDMSAEGGADNAYDMAQNAKHEQGLLDWVKKNLTDDETPLERIQWDIEANV